MSGISVKSQLPSFAPVPWALQDDPRIDPSALAVYAALMRFSDFGKGTGCKASITRIAKTARVSRRTCCDRLELLRSAGWLSWKPGNMSGVTNCYNVRFAPPSAPRAHPLVQEAHTPSAPRAHNREPFTENHKPRDYFTPHTKRATWVTPYYDAWVKRYGGKPAVGQLAKAMKALHDEHGEAVVVARWGKYLEATDAQYVSPQRFAQTWGAWANGGSWADEFRAMRKELEA